MAESVSATLDVPTSTPSSVGLPPLSVAIQTIGVAAVALVGSSISSQLVDLAIADVGGAFSVSADQASWIAGTGRGCRHSHRGDPGARPTAQVASAEAALLSAKFALHDTEIRAPIDGIVANRKTRVGEYVTAGSRMLSVVPIENLWIEANFRETQLGRMKTGDPVRINVDTYPGKTLCGYVESITPASGSEFALVPPDNATGNFTKIVRRFTVRIRFNASEANATLVRPGMSVETEVAVSLQDKASSPERARRIGCSLDLSHDIVEHLLAKLPEHPGLGRARPQGAAGTQISPEPAR